MDDYQRIEKAILFLERNVRKQPRLAEVAASVGLSEHHFQRMFTRWAGVSPKRLLQCLTLEQARRALRESHSVLDAAYHAGLSGPGRLHDLFVTLEAITPGEFKRGAEGLTIEYGIQPSPFGACLIATTGRGVCGLAFLDDQDERPALHELTERWPGATLRPAADGHATLARRVFRSDSHAIDGDTRSTPAGEPRPDAPLRLLVRGTHFQVKVWEALLRVPAGNVVTYQRIAERIGRPRAARAVGSAVGRNDIGFLIPCHRVIRKVGLPGDYRWGHLRKRAILAWESARAHPSLALEHPPLDAERRPNHIRPNERSHE